MSNWRLKPDAQKDTRGSRARRFGTEMSMRSVAMACILVVGLELGGCTYPQGAGSGAGYAGDRASLALSEVVVSVVVAGTDRLYQNIHVGLAAIINPRQVSMYDPYDVRSLVKRLEARIDARIVELLAAGAQTKVSDLGLLRNRLEQGAQEVVDSAMATWKHAHEYEVRIVVSSLYFTEGSVGRQPVKDNSWW